jgi:exopolyphosphatase/guanosine-5'-triphosphate,3'-diphosphate pyrophosphatase
MKSPRTHARTKSRSWVRVEGGPVLACIDMGTNSFHMIVCRANPERDHFDIITKAKEAVPFFRRALSAHYIDETALRSAIRILKDMKAKAVERGATHILTVATSAVRESKNGLEVMARIRHELEIDAKVISGHEEARLIYLGVLWSMPHLEGRFAIVDIGGGSTEIIVADREQTVFSESYKLGAARLTQRFFRREISAETIRELHDEVRGMLRPAAAAIYARGGFEQLIGTSGTIQALAKLDRVRKGEPQAELHGRVIGLKDLVDIVSWIEQCSVNGDRIENVSSDRNQTVLAGAIVLLETMRSLGASSIKVCTSALREGVVVDRFLQTGWLDIGLDRHADPRSDSVHMLLDKYRANMAHADQVARLATEIFRQTEGILHHYPETAGHLLWSAAMLHDVGTFIGRNGHHKHSYYLIKNAGLLGHSEEELELIASIARYHRGSEPKDSHPNYSGLPQMERKLVSDMAAMLRVAEALDRSHRQVIEQIRVTIEVDQKTKAQPTLALHLFLKNGEGCRAETWAFSEKKEFFENQFGVNATLLVGWMDLSRGPIDGSFVQRTQEREITPSLVFDP